MENIIEILESKKITISLQYYGVQDFGTSWEIKAIVDNPEIFNDLFSRFPLTEISKLEDYYLYLLSRKFICLREVIPALLQEELKVIISELSDSAEKAISNIRTGDVIRFINESIEEIFSQEMSLHGIQFVTLDIIAMYSTGIGKGTFDYLSKHYGYLLIDRFEQFEKIFEQYPDVFEAIYPTGRLAEVKSIRLEGTLDVWSHIMRKGKSKLKSIIIYRIDVLAEDIRKLWATATIDNILQIERTIREFLFFLQQIQNPKAYEFSEYQTAATEMLSKSIVEKGQSFKYEIPVEEIVSRWKKTENWELRLLYLTHDLALNNGAISCISRLTNKSETKHPLIDLVSTNVPTDDFFTISHQQWLSVLASVGTGTMLGILRQQDTRIDYLNLVVSAIVIISSELQAAGENLKQDAEMLSAMVHMVADSMGVNNDALRALCFGASMFICAFSEKLLRILYTQLVKEEKYIPINKATLGELLTVNNSYIRDVFGENHIKNLSFFLQRTPVSNVGYNIRNALAHWAKVRTTAMTPSFVAHCLWLFTDILNSVLWYCLKNDIEKGENNDQL